MISIQNQLQKDSQHLQNINANNFISKLDKDQLLFLQQK